jgi:uncharacterized membrane protein
MMMTNIFSLVITGIATIAIVYGLVAIFIAVWSITKQRDALYREKYEEFLEQKKRVKNRLRRPE